MSKAGNFEIEVWRGGYPVWCVVSHHGVERFRISHTELRDLQYTVEKAMREARLELSEKDREEV